MHIQDLIALYQTSDVITRLTTSLRQNPSQAACHLSGVNGSLDAMLIAALYYRCKEMQVVILETKEESVALYGDLKHLLEGHSVLLFPSLESKDDHAKAAHKIIKSKRTEVIQAIGSKNPPAIIITHGKALQEKVVDPKALSQFRAQLQLGQTILLHELERHLQEKEFTKVDFVSAMGEYAIRGGIVDIYSAASAFPYRIELWGNTISSIRNFSLKDQKSFKELHKASILHPHTNVPLSSMPYSSLANFLPLGSCVWFKHKRAVLEKLHHSANATPSNEEEPHDTIEALEASLAPYFQISLEAEYTSIPKEAAIHIAYQSDKQPNFQQNFNLLHADVIQKNTQDYRVLITSVSTGQLSRLTTILQAKDPNPAIHLLTLGLREGYVDHTLRIACYTDHQIFNRYYAPQLPTRHPPATSIPSASLFIDEFKTVQVGDYVVHTDYGIGKFAGLHTFTINGRQQEMVRLVYRHNDMVYVSLQDLYKVSKYTSKDGRIPTIHKLGSTTWQLKKRP